MEENNVNDLKYEEALAELGLIASKMENGGYDIDQLADQLCRAQQLIKLCRAKLTQTDEEIKKILEASNGGE